LPRRRLELKDLFDNFFSIEPPPLIDTEECAASIPHENVSNDENTCHKNVENNTMGLANTVITVTTVTAKNATELVDCNRNTYLPNNLYRLYEQILLNAIVMSLQAHLRYRLTIMYLYNMKLTFMSFEHKLRKSRPEGY
jgi:hypothetical protein